jgi:hypothetical protein
MPEDTGHRDNLLNKLYNSARIGITGKGQMGLKPAAASLGLFGVIVMLLWLAMNDGSTMAMLLLIAGLSIISVSILLFFLSPSVYLRSDVCDAMSISNTMSIGNLLTSLLVESRGIYIPAGDNGFMRVFLPLSSGISVEDINSIGLENAVFKVSGNGVKGLYLIPPGYGLFKYSRSIGAAFTKDGIENEIKDVVQNGLELASDVAVKREGDRVEVSLGNMANIDMCRAIRKESPGICSQIGCPVCSFVGCMVASGTGKKARIENTAVNDNTVKVTYKLM